MLAGADYRGHKGSLRWVADYNLVHRYGFAIAAPGRAPELLLPQNLGQARPGGWDVPTSFARDLRIGLPEALRAIGPMRRIGVVGLAQVMKVEDYLALRDAFPDAEIVDASDAFERLRAHKAPEEIEGVRESVAIADACFDRLLEVARIGITEREIGAAMYERCYALGGEDPLFLSMYPGARGTAASEGRFGPPVDRVLERGEQLVFSFELVGRMGYWMEFARMVVFGEPTELQQRMNAAVIAGLEGGAEQMRPGKRPGRGAGGDHERGRRARRRLQLLVGARHRPGRDRGAVARARDRAGPRASPRPGSSPTAWCSRTTPTPSTAAGEAVGYMADTFLVTARGRQGLLAEAADALRRRVSAQPRIASSRPSCSAACTRSRRRWRRS